jgi:hypothetical protein
MEPFVYEIIATMALYLTKKQQSRIETIFNEFYTHAIVCDHESFTPMFKTQLNMVKGMMEDGIPFDQAELNFLIFVLDWYFSSMSENHVDPLAEQAYAKLTGDFTDSFDKPWYERIRCLKEQQGG